jgi:Fic family protein
VFASTTVRGFFRAVKTGLVFAVSGHLLVLMKDALGFFYDANLFTAVPLQAQAIGLEAAIFHLKKMLPQYVFDSVALEGNPFTFPEVQTVLDGVTVGGHKIADQEQVLNQRDAHALMIDLVRNGRFAPTAAIATALNARVAKGEALRTGAFRDGPVGIAGTSRWHPAPHQKLKEIYERGVTWTGFSGGPLERAYVLSAWIPFHQFFYDGNKWTGRLLMNGTLLSNGLAGLSIPAKFRKDYNEACLALYDGQDATPLFRHMLAWHRSGFLADGQ